MNEVNTTASEDKYSENVELLHAARNGDHQALDKLMKLNSGLVRSLSMRFLNRGAELDDLMQLGYLGLIKAVRNFDFSYNTAFSTYAVPLIIGEIRRFLRDDGLIRVGRKTKQLGARLFKIREEFVMENGREPTLDKLCELCGERREDVILALDTASVPLSLNEPSPETGQVLESAIADENDSIGALCEKIALKSALASLSPFRRKIVYMRYFKELTQSECAKLLGVTQVKISREEKKILECLKSELM